LGGSGFIPLVRGSFHQVPWSAALDVAIPNTRDVEDVLESITDPKGHTGSVLSTVDNIIACNTIEAISTLAIAVSSNLPNSLKTGNVALELPRNLHNHFHVLHSGTHLWYSTGNGIQK